MMHVGATLQQHMMCSATSNTGNLLWVAVWPIQKLNNKKTAPEDEPEVDGGPVVRHQQLCSAAPTAKHNGDEHTTARSMPSHAHSTWHGLHSRLHAARLLSPSSRSGEAHLL